MTFHSSNYHADRRRCTDMRASGLFNDRNFYTYGVPTRIDENGYTLTWEPEFGPTLETILGIIGAKNKLSEIPNFRLLSQLHRDFSYVSATINAPEGYAGRVRYNFFKASNSNFYAPSREIHDPQIGIKSDIKSKYRSENEATLNASLDIADGLEKLRNDPNNPLPPGLCGMNAANTHMTGLMCVERAGFESTHLLKDGNHAHLISYAGSFDVGTCHDIRYIHDGPSSAIANHIEAEQEVTEIRSTAELSDEEVAEIIEASMIEIEPQFNAVFAEHSMSSDNPRILMGKNTRAAYEQHSRTSTEKLKAMNMQPSALLKKQNAQGLCSIFDGQNSTLITPKMIHQLSELDADQMLLVQQSRSFG